MYNFVSLNMRSLRLKTATNNAIRGSFAKSGILVPRVCLSFLPCCPGNQQLILASVIRHLDHKNVVHDPQLKTCVIQVATSLAMQIRSGRGLAEIGLVDDLCRHLRKSLQSSGEFVGEQELNLNILLQISIEDCLLEIAKRVGS